MIGNNYEGELPQIGNTFQWMDNFSKASVARTCFAGPRLLNSSPRVLFSGQTHAVESEAALVMLFGGDMRLYARRCI